MSAYHLPVCQVPVPDTRFDALLQRYENMVYALALNLTGCAADAEQVQSKVFVSLLKNESCLVDADGSFLNLIGQTLAQTTELLEGRAYSVVQIANEEEAFAESDVLAEAIQGNLQKLPFEYRKVLVLRDVFGLTVGETSQVLAITSDDCRTRLRRARLMLRRTLFRDRANLTIVTPISADDELGVEPGFLV